MFFFVASLRIKSSSAEVKVRFCKGHLAEKIVEKIILSEVEKHFANFFFQQADELFLDNVWP
jgi:hypothetical protein